MLQRKEINRLSVVMWLEIDSSGLTGFFNPGFSDFNSRLIDSWSSKNINY